MAQTPESEDESARRLRPTRFNAKTKKENYHDTFLKPSPHHDKPDANVGSISLFDPALKTLASRISFCVSAFPTGLQVKEVDTLPPSAGARAPSLIRVKDSRARFTVNQI
jgi:hypothetical protein